MLEKWHEFKRKNAVKILGLAGLALLILILLVSLRGKHEKNAATAEDRAAFLQSLGWEIEAGNEQSAEVTIPDCGEGAMADYNALMQKAGFDLSAYQGKSVRQYRYVLTNYPDCKDKVYAVLYVSHGRVIGGDIHTASLHGFMHELRARDTTE